MNFQQLERLGRVQLFRVSRQQTCSTSPPRVLMVRSSTSVLTRSVSPGHWPVRPGRRRYPLRGRCLRGLLGLRLRVFILLPTCQIMKDTNSKAMTKRLRCEPSLVFSGIKWSGRDGIVTTRCKGWHFNTRFTVNQLPFITQTCAMPQFRSLNRLE